MKLVMTLRKKIEEEIKKSANPELAAIEICKLLEDEIGLEGNGWFDDDPEFVEML